MGTGAKIAIGCAIAVVVIGIVIMVALGGAVWWAKGKVEQVAGEQQKIEGLLRKADASSFTRPADGVIQEPRLVKFLDVRKSVFAVYEKHEADIEAMQKKDKADFGDVRKAFNWMNEIRLAQAQALADLGMSQEEYRFLVESVYKTMWASEVAKSTGGKSFSEATGDAMDQAAEQMRQAMENAPPEQREALRQSLEQMEKSAEEARAQAEQVDVPPANIELFRKYEADIKKYAMTGLEVVGL